MIRFVRKRDTVALTGLSGERRFEVIEGATHFFQEPGALEAVTELAKDWFLQHLPA